METQSIAQSLPIAPAPEGITLKKAAALSFKCLISGLALQSTMTNVYYAHKHLTPFLTLQHRSGPKPFPREPSAYSVTSFCQSLAQGHTSQNQSVSTMVPELTFQSLNAKTDALRREYLTYQADWWHVVTKGASSMLMPMATTAGTYSLSRLFPKMFGQTSEGHINSNWVAQATQGLSLFGGLSFMIPGILDSIRSLWTLKPTLDISNRAFTTELRKSEITLACALPDDVKLALAAIYQCMDPGSDKKTEYRPVIPKSEHSKEKNFFHFTQIRNALLSVPSRSSPIQLDDEQKEALQQLIDSYSPETGTMIEMKVNQVIQNTNNEKSPSRTQIYFYGPAGVGKTYCAQQLAKILGRPLVTIPIENVHTFRQSLFGKNIGIEQICDDNWKPMGQEDNVDLHTVVFGRLAMAIIESGQPDPIIFLDEAGDGLSSEHQRQLITILKEITDPTFTHIHLPKLGLQIDFSRVTLLAAGNYPLDDGPLRSRIGQIDFVALPEATQKRAGQQALLQFLESYPEEDKRTLIELWENNRWLDLIVTHGRDLGEGGARIIQNVVKDMASRSALQILSSKQSLKEYNFLQDLKHIYPSYRYIEPIHHEERTIPLHQGVKLTIDCATVCEKEYSPV